MPGNILSDSELTELETVLEKLLEDNDIFVLSGSLAEEMPIDYYAKLISCLVDKNTKVVLDTSGSALKEALKEDIYLIKPNQRELAHIAGKDFLSSEEQEKFALEIIKSTRLRYVVVSLGARGAFIASNNGITYQSNPPVLVKSTVGAGDSMVAGLIYALKNKVILYISPQGLTREAFKR